MCKNELQGIRIQRSTREEQKTDVLSAIYKKDLKDLIVWVANEEGRNKIKLCVLTIYIFF